MQTNAQNGEPLHLYCESTSSQSQIYGPRVPTWQQIEASGEHSSTLDDEPVVRVIDAEAMPTISRTIPADHPGQGEAGGSGDPQWGALRPTRLGGCRGRGGAKEALEMLFDRIRCGRFGGSRHRARWSAARAPSPSRYDEPPEPSRRLSNHYARLSMTPSKTKTKTT